MQHCRDAGNLVGVCGVIENRHNLEAHDTHLGRWWLLLGTSNVDHFIAGSIGAEQRRNTSFPTTPRVLWLCGFEVLDRQPARTHDSTGQEQPLERRLLRAKDVRKCSTRSIAGDSTIWYINLMAFSTQARY
jgi:hypothetical protein